MTNPGDVERVMEIGRGRRLNAAPDALAAEIRGNGGVWTRVRVIPYEDIRAIYRFEVTDWTTLWWLFALWISLLAASVIVAGFSGWPPAVILSATGLVTVTILAIAVFRIRSAPARKLKIEAHSGILLVPDRSSKFCALLATTVHGRTTPPLGAAPHGALQSASPAPNSEPINPPSSESLPS